MESATADGEKHASSEDGAKTPAPPLGGSNVSVSETFSLGWNICLLYLSGEQANWRQPPEPPDRLPSPSLFSEPEHSLIRLGQVRSAIRHLSGNLLAGTDGSGSAFAEVGTEIEVLFPDRERAGDCNPRLNLSQAHLALAQALSETDPRLAKAYHLGCDLAAICNAPRDLASLQAEFQRDHIAQVGEALADLTSLFPDHSCRAVRLSCAEWRRWMENPELSIAEAGSAGPTTPQRLERVQARLGKPRPLVWEKDGEDVLCSLVRQGEVWRALLSGEKPGTAMLELQDYFATGARALKNAFQLLGGMWKPLVVVVLLLVIGCWLLVSDAGALAKAAGLVTVASAAGLTWKGVLGGLGPVVGRIQEPVWGAALDDVIAGAITVLPTGAQEASVDARSAAPASGPQPEAFVTGSDGKRAGAA